MYLYYTKAMNKYLRTTLVALCCLYFWYYIATYTEGHLIDNVDLIFHEAGHTIFFFFGQFIQVCAGSGFQILLPLLISIYFFKTGQKLSGALCLLWLGQNILNVSVYAGDAIAMQLELLGGDGVMHDWNYILSTLDILRYAPRIAHMMYEIGFITIATGMVMSVYYSVTDTAKETLG
jgi:predicted secreted protein